MHSNILTISVLSLALFTTACGKSDDATEQTAENAAQVSTQVEEGVNDSYEVNDNIAANIVGAGASFPALIYQKWADEYEIETGGKVSYDAVGSSTGVRVIREGSVDFGASDRPLTPKELAEKNFIQFPTVIGGIVPIINIKGINTGDLVLDAELLAKIYVGDIQKWNDAAIRALNPDLALPNANITTVYRKDGSGSTYNFSHYLNQAAPIWSTVGVGKQLKWPTATTGTGLGVIGSKELAKKVQNTANAIGYIDYSYAKENGLVYTSMINAAGTQVKPSHESFAAAGDIDWSKHDGFYKFITNSKSEKAWPIATTTFIIVNKNPQDPKKVAGVLNFFNWAYMKGYQSALDLDFVPFADRPVAIFLKEWEKIVDEDNKPVYKIHSNI